MRFAAATLTLSLSICALALTGCDMTADGNAPGESNAVDIHGVLYGGQQSVNGGHIYLFAVNSTGNGGSGLAAATTNASVSLLNSSVATHNPLNYGEDSNDDYYVTSGAGGVFSISSDYSCTAGYSQSAGAAVVLSGTEQVYLYAVSGDAGAGTNTAIGFLAALGPCSGLSSSTTVWVDEVTTVATAYALAGFATDATHISSSGSALGLTGILNASANAKNLANFTTGNALTATPNGNGTVPQSELNTLADILANCVNSASSTSTQCNLLLGAATSTGISTGAKPTDTATAAINIAHYPGSNVATLYGSPGPTTPFSPTLGTQPNNFTVSLAFTGGGITATNLQPHALAFDATGNAWIASTNGSVLSEFSPLGVPVSTAGYSTGLGLNQPFSVALNAASTQIWIANSNGDTVTDFTISGATGATHSTGTNSAPYDVALDGSGNAWVANSNNSVVELNSSGTLQGSTITGNGLNLPYSVAIQPGATGNVWVADFNFNTASVFTSARGTYADDGSGSIHGPAGIAIDSGGYVWSANGNTSVSKLAAGGTTGTNYVIGASGALMDSIAIDGAGNVWVTDNNDSTVYEATNGGTKLSPAAGFVPVPVTTPDALAIDGSGNVWYTSQSAATLRELIGAAAPVVTPIAYGVANTLLGTRP